MAENDLLIITDIAEGRSQNSVLESVVRRVASPDIGLIASGIRRLTKTELENFRQESLKVPNEAYFNENFNSVKDFIDINELLRYSEKTCPNLNKRLREGVSVKDALWKTYNESLQGMSLDSNVNYFDICVNEAEKAGYPHVLEVFFDHNVIAADFGKQGTIPYHLIGRGFVAEGCRWPLYLGGEVAKSKSIILFPLGLYSTPEEQAACAEELVNHEITGHMLSRLYDHSAAEISPEKCVMSVPFSREDFVKLAMQKRGLVLCGDCKAQYEARRKK